MNIIELSTAFFAGILSFLSPCILPLIPGYISFVSGISLDEIQSYSARKKINIHVLLSTVFFVAGFSAVFIGLGASATFLGRILIQKIELFSRIGGIIIIIFGLQIMGILRIGFLARQKSAIGIKTNIKYVGSLLLGMGFAFGWTPCVGPILGGILIYASDKETISRGVALLGAYSAGIGLPFIITALSVNYFLIFFKKFKKYIRVTEIVSGLLLVAVGILIFFGKLEMLMSFFG